MAAGAEERAQLCLSCCLFFFFKHFLKDVLFLQLGIVAHTFKPSIREAETSGALSSRSAGLQRK